MSSQLISVVMRSDPDPALARPATRPPACPSACRGLNWEHRNGQPTDGPSWLSEEVKRSLILIRYSFRRRAGARPKERMNSINFITSRLRPCTTQPMPQYTTTTTRIEQRLACSVHPTADWWLGYIGLHIGHRRRRSP